MLSLALTFLIVGLVAGLLGLYGVAAVASQIAWSCSWWAWCCSCSTSLGPAGYRQRSDAGSPMRESLWAAIGIWLVFVLVFASLVGA